jgi:hypothetical protein
MNEKTQQANIQFGITRKSLEAVLIHACPHCGAPGVYKNWTDLRSRERWPGCYHPEWRDIPVGAVCPNCHQNRTKDRNLGELTASMPKWIWLCVLSFKWCVLKTIMLRRLFT